MSALESTARNTQNLSAFEKSKDVLARMYHDLASDLPDEVQSELTIYVSFVGTCFVSDGEQDPRQTACETCQQARQDALARCRNLSK